MENESKETIFVDGEGCLSIGGMRASKLAYEYGTPLYCLDEATVRRNAAAFRDTLAAEYPDSTVCFASKALCNQGVYRLMSEEGIGIDCVSGGELYTAATADFDFEKVYFHGSNKLPFEVEMALNLGVHAIVADGESDIELLSQIAHRMSKRPRVLLRVNPGIEAHTHEFVQTARPDSKFGVAMAGGAALSLIERFLQEKDLDFVGLHCHIGSQILETEPFEKAVDLMTDLMKAVKDTTGTALSEFNMGGGFGIKYVESDDPQSPAEYARAVAKSLKANVAKKNLKAPRLILEPGRSMVADAGVTLYTVGAVKEIPALKKYVSVDGGMFDNPRYALYRARYTALLADRAGEVPTETVTIAGKCCESGDILVADARLPKAKRGDILAVLGTGAYNYTLSSHYNRNLIPPMVLVRDGYADYLICPETYDDLIRRDFVPGWLRPGLDGRSKV